MPNHHNISLRLSDRLSERLAMASILLGCTQSQLLRNFLDEGLQRLQATPGFRDKVRDRQEILAEILEETSSPGEDPYSVAAEVTEKLEEYQEVLTDMGNSEDIR